MTNADRVIIGNTVEAHNNSAVVSSIGSVWHLDDIAYLGLRSPSNTLSVLDGAEMRAPGLLAIGTYETASNNVLRVAGAATRFNGDTLHFGTYGAENQLLVEDFAIAQLGRLIFNTEGTTNGGRQVAIVRGLATQLLITNLLQIGNSPENVFVLSNGASVYSRTMTLGTGPRSHFNRAELSGPGTRWNGGDVVVGTALSSSNTVSVIDYADFRASRFVLGQTSVGNDFFVDSGGRLSPGQLIMGEHQSASHNHLEIVGPGSTLSNITLFTIGQSGTQNEFRLYGGAYGYSGDTTLGMQFTSSNNLAIASGTNTLWIANRLTVGSAGDFNTFTIDDGAKVFGSSLLSGGQGGSGNATYVNGPGSLLSITNGIDIGSGNYLSVGERARLESGNAMIGSYGTNSTAVLARSSWSNQHSLTLGQYGANNVLLIAENSRLNSSNVVIGSSDTADGNRADVWGKGTALHVVNDISLGAWGDTNSLAIYSAAWVSTRNLNVGGFFVQAPPALFPSDENSLLISGASTAVNVSSNLSLGYYGGWNRLELARRASLTSSRAQVATRAGSANNMILISDPGTHWHNTNEFLLGSNGHGSFLMVSTGAKLTTGSAILGDGGFAVPVGGGKCTNRFGFNDVRVSGPGAIMEVGGQLIIGKNSTSNSVTVNRGGTLRVNEIMAGFFGTACLPQEDENVLVLDGGNLVVSNRLFVGPRGRFQMLSGRAEVDSFWVESYPTLRAQVLGGTLRADSIYASAPAEIRIGDGSRRTMVELTGGSYFSSGRIIIASNSVLAGRGSISGGFTNSGTYGTLRGITVITNETLQGCSGFDVWMAGSGPATGHSVLNVGLPGFGTAVLDGWLRVALNPSFHPEASTEFPIVVFSSATGAFSNAPHGSRLKTVDNLASFLVLYRSNAVVLTDYRSTDTDGDAIEDEWARNYFGHSPLNAAEKSADSDGDGFSNYDEFRAGTDPTDPASALRVSIAITQGTTSLQWPCVDGKTYRVYVSGDLRTWREVADPTFAFPEAGICQWTDDGRDGGSMWFYRVAVE